MCTWPTNYIFLSNSDFEQKWQNPETLRKVEIAEGIWIGQQLQKSRANVI